ncbi:MAG: beta-lactamase induction signal transducer [Alphaproteobacteria bacterium]|nr:beta-lactamase induction signal transducer [Alphaproteobacteria bacterium]
MTDATAPPVAKRKSALPPWSVILSNRKTASMLILGFASGLPMVLIIGTLTAWFSDAKVDLSTIGVFSWIGLAYAFKFLWSPILNTTLPVTGTLLGQRRGWIIVCQAVIALAVLGIAMTDPTASLGLMALVAAVAAFASATQDIAIDAWRIEIADDRAPLDVLSAIYQLGYRTAALIGAAAALFLAQWTSWPFTFAMGGILMATTMLGTLIAPEPETIKEIGSKGPRTAAPRVRFFSVAIVILAWGWAAHELISFMATAVTTVPPPNAKDFTAFYGPLIVAATVLLPSLIAAWIARGGSLPNADKPVTGGALQLVADRLYAGIVEPLVELMSRLGLAAILILCVILTYQITYSIWGPFAYPFYLGELGYTKIEVAIASKIIGVIMTMTGIGLAAFSLVQLGRMPTMLLGGMIAAIANLLFADLANGGANIDAFLSFFWLSDFFTWIGVDARLARLITGIAGENIATGFAGAAFVAYVSSLASKMQAAVQFAVFTSLTLLVGTLGRGALGDMIKEQGYAAMFEFAAMLGLVSIVFVALEWYRQSRHEAKT